MIEELRSLVRQIRVDASKKKSQDITVIILTEKAMQNFRAERIKAGWPKPLVTGMNLAQFEKVTCEVVPDYFTATRIALDTIEAGKAVMLVN